MNRKNIIRIMAVSAVLVAVVFSAIGCKMKMDLSSTAGGKPYELIVSVSDNAWNSEVADTLASIFQAPVEMLNQFEPMYDMMRVQPSAMKDLIIRHRNILVVQIDPSAAEPKSVAVIDPYASPQLMITVTAKDNAAMAAYLGENRAELQQIFNIQERNRATLYNKTYGNKRLEEEIEQMFGIKISIPQTFEKKKTVSHNFIWFGQEYPVASQGVVIYSYPYSGESDFTPENLAKRRNDFVAHIPGPRAPEVDSYMITTKEFEPEVRYVRIGDRTWSEMRGFWDVYNDFMGGPFVSYSTLDPNSGNVITIEGYVYSPKNPKRNMLRALEHLVHSVEFTGTGS